MSVPDGREAAPLLERDPTRRAVAILLARWIVGLIFTMAGYWKVFILGPGAHARQFFLTPYADSWIPSWLLWVSGTSIPVIELVAGAALILGVGVELACYALGAVLVTVTYGHLLAEPLYDFTGHVIPRLSLLLAVLVSPSSWDRFRLSRLLRRGHESRSEPRRS